jgi:hypothetical protein
MTLEQQIQKLLRDVFAAAKEKYPDQTGDIKYFDGDSLPYFPDRFKTFDDYLKHLKSNVNGMDVSLSKHDQRG